METEVELTDRQMIPGSSLLFGVASTAIGLGCALPVQPGMELIRFFEREAVLQGERGWSFPEWESPDSTEWRSSIFEARENSWRDAYSAPGIHAIELSATDIDSRSSTPVFQHLDSLISNLVMPASWQAEGVENPTDACRMYAQSLLRRLYGEYNLIPYKASISKDGGLYAAYRSASGRITLRVEIDNELDAVAVVTNGSEILNSGLLDDDDERSIISSLNSDPA